VGCTSGMSRGYSTHAILIFQNALQILVIGEWSYLWTENTPKIDEYTTDGVMEEKRLKYKNCWTLDDIKIKLHSFI
jgi:hypothetical protein